MAKRLQHRGGTTSQHSTFTGAVREVTVDTDKNTLVVHDGATAGGHPLATATNFTSTGIDDNATSTAITIDSSQNVTISGDTLTVGDGHTIGNDGTFDNLLIQSSTGENIEYNSGLGSHIFKQNGTEVFRIKDTTGNVGIGTSSPAPAVGTDKVLEIAGSVSPGLVINDTGQAQKYQLYADSTKFKMSYGSTNFFTYDASNGNLGIGVSSPQEQVDISSTSPRIRFSDTSVANLRHVIGSEANDLEFSCDVGNVQADSHIGFKIDGSERMRIDSSGNVGIGVTPSATSATGSTIKGLVLGGNTANGVYTGLQILNRVENSTTSNGISIDFDHKTSGATTIPLARLIAFPSGSTSGNLRFYTSSSSSLSERMRIIDSGNVGIGTTNPIGLVNIVQASNTQALLRLRNNTADTSAADGMIFTITDSSSPVGSIEMVSGGSDASLAFRTNGSERMQIASNGHVGLGKAVSDANTVSGIKFFQSGQQYLYTAASTNIMRFYDSSTGTLVGNINITGSTTAYNTSSDYRLKENVNYDFDATTRLKQLKPARFNFIADADKTVDGFLAHEVSDIVPEAITGEKDAVDENGNPEYQGIDQSKLVPLLVKTIQELEARITALETNQPQ